mmetsp:Transcript_6036/g.8829  ORF Transcript_6036/g.8829 Transcript_6036/m.8829 type:complete len:381 (+) Transcript_6036:165-1307(+)|eukprot:CAMPEP_0172415338 /NCGR_PEP_ID=MMETSP1064-20121228/1760_1 /TAXON_ID=202472 /ORGANISM="Aulacoseira subarctica , Strain CCAP 1002/5" /LENGTH=380 /DNA_ID=CAMNT_0013152277 /DNA_START=109 /DNA_END=1251 /DNA_ORIENTATION=-
MIPSNELVELQNQEKEPEEDTCDNGWFSSRKIGAMAWRLRESIPSAGAAVRQTLDGIADIAMFAATIALEFNEMEREAREQADKDEDEEQERGGDRHRSTADVATRSRSNHEEMTANNNQESMEHFVQCCNKAFSKLPWEVWVNDVGADNRERVCYLPPSKYESSIPGSFVDDFELKEKILALSLDEKTFTEPFLENDALVIENSLPFGGDLEYDAQYCFFEQQKRTTTAHFLEENKSSINRLLQVDSKLSKIHEELVGSSKLLSEGEFWKNYFFHCERLRITLENERSNRGNRFPPVDISKSDQKSDYSSTKGRSMSPSMSKTSSFKDEEFDDAVLVSKNDAFPPFIHKYPQTLSNGSMVLIGGSDGEDFKKFCTDRES